MADSAMFRRIDYPFLVITLILVAAGRFVVYSASIVVSQKNFGTPYGFLMNQGIAALIGLAALVAAQLTPYKIWKKISLLLLAVSFGFSLAVFAPKLWLSFGGATRWLFIFLNMFL